MKNPAVILLTSLILISCSSRKKIESSSSSMETMRIESAISELTKRFKEEIASSILLGTISATIIDYDTSVSVCDSLGKCINPIDKKVDIKVDFSKKDDKKAVESDEGSRKEDVKTDISDQKEESTDTEVKGSSFVHDFKVAGISFVIAFFVLFLLRVIKVARK